MKHFYVYPATQPFTITASSRSTDSININDQYDFRVQYITFYVATSYKLLIQLRVNNTNYFNNAVLAELICGNGQQANYFPFHAVFHKSDRIQLDWQNTHTSDLSVYLAFTGFELKPIVDLKKT